MAESRKPQPLASEALEIDVEPYPKPGRVLMGKYRLDQQIGAGGMGAVFLAENVDISRKVAVKVLQKSYLANPEMFARFKQEARAASAIRHRSICDVLDMGETEDGVAFIVMEYLQGETLKARIGRRKQLDLGHASWIISELLDVVSAAHEQRVIHRDLKPDNVFLVERPVKAVKVLDFGLSKFRDGNLTRTGRIFGTPSYMSPEQAQSTKTVGPAADLYSVGAIFFHALTGRTPFVGGSQTEILGQLLSQPVPRVRTLRKDIPEAVAKIIDGLLIKDPEKRPSDARLVREELLEATRGLPKDDPLEAPLSPPVAPSGRAPAVRPATRPDTPAQLKGEKHESGETQTKLEEWDSDAALEKKRTIQERTTEKSAEALEKPKERKKAPREKAPRDQQSAGKSSVLLSPQVMIGLTAVGVLVLGFGLYRSTRPAEHAASAAQSEGSQELRVDPPLAGTRWTFARHGQKSGAVVSLQGAWGDRETVKITAEGYKEETSEFSLESHEPIVIRLEKLDPPAATPKKKPPKR